MCWDVGCACAVLREAEEVRAMNRRRSRELAEATEQVRPACGCEECMKWACASMQKREGQQNITLPDKTTHALA